MNDFETKIISETDSEEVSIKIKQYSSWLYNLSIIIIIIPLYLICLLKDITVKTGVDFIDNINIKVANIVLVILVINLLVLIIKLFKSFGKKIVLTKDRILIYSFSKEADIDINYALIAEVNIESSTLQKLKNVGTISITKYNGEKIFLATIKDAKRVTKLIRELSSR